MAPTDGPLAQATTISDPCPPRWSEWQCSVCASPNFVHLHECKPRHNKGGRFHRRAGTRLRCSPDRAAASALNKLPVTPTSALRNRDSSSKSTPKPSCTLASHTPNSWTSWQPRASHVHPDLRCRSNPLSSARAPIREIHQTLEGHAPLKGA